jgi:uncharacterized protein (TIGR00251 family)
LTPPTLDVKPADGGATFRVRVAPRASRNAVTGERAGALVVRLTAPPVEGAANQALRKFLGKALGAAPSALSVVHGETSRDKTLRVAGIAAPELAARLQALVPEQP